MPFFYLSSEGDKLALSFDPRQLPVDALGGETALAPERLDAPWLRARFARPPEWQAETADEALFARLGAGRSPTPAAVLIPLVLRADGIAMLLTQRTAHLT